MQRRPSLKDRVTLVTIGVLAVGLALLSVGFNVLLTSRLHADANTVLRTRAEAQQAAVSSRNGRLRVIERRHDAVLDRQAWVFDGKLAIEKPAAPSPAVEQAVQSLVGVAHRTVFTVGHVRLLAVPVLRRAAQGTIVVGVSLVPYEHTQTIALVGSIVLSVCLLLASTLAVRWSVGSALRPVARMTRHAAQWSAHDLGRRFDLGPPSDELTLLASTFDGLLGRIESVLRHEQRFSAEMAHELRTPLTGVRAEAELALQTTDLDPATAEAFQRILTGTGRMTTVIETLLSSARAAGGRTGRCDPVPAVRQVLAVVEPSAQSRGVTLELAAAVGPATVEASSEMVGQAVHPLLENAIRHAASRVEVQLRRRNGEVAVTVTDDGPGIDGQDPEDLFVPGVSATGSAGLGLPLARRLARSCGGDVVAVPGGRGGHFELRLPAGGPDASPGQDVFMAPEGS